MIPPMFDPTLIKGKNVIVCFVHIVDQNTNQRIKCSDIYISLLPLPDFMHFDQKLLRI